MRALALLLLLACRPAEVSITEETTPSAVADPSLGVQGPVGTAPAATTLEGETHRLRIVVGEPVVAREVSDGERVLRLGMPTGAPHSRGASR